MGYATIRHSDPQWLARREFLYHASILEQYEKKGDVLDNARKCESYLSEY
mgnify:FL=1|jgi:hypothetical protein